MSTCVICDRTVYKESNKCLFHVDKGDWFANHSNHKTWNNNLVTIFWKEIRELVADQSLDEIDFSYFIFPQFEVSNANKQLVIPPENEKYDECLIAPFDFNFWKKGSKIGFEKDVTFLYATFLDDASFSALTQLTEKGQRRPIIYKRICFQSAKFFGLADFSHVYFKGISDFFYFECEEANFNGCTFPDLFLLDGAKIFKSIKLSGDGIENISFNSLEANDFELNISNTRSKNMPQKQSLNLYGMKFNGNVIINDKSNSNIIKELVIKQTSFLSGSTLTLSDFNLKKLEFMDITNLSSLITIRNIHIQDKLTFQNLSFQNTEFIDFFANTKDCNIIMNQITILKSKFINFKINSINKNDIDSSRVVYQQIKSAYDFQKDYINANVYYAKEMNAYQDEVFKSKPWNDLMDKTIFWFGKTISNFSQNWFCKPPLKPN